MLNYREKESIEVIDKKLHDNKLESYLLAWIMAGFHTDTDSFYKRGRKGFLFTLGDEPCLKKVPGEALERFLGYQKGAGTITATEALEKAQEQYEVFHIHITNASYSLREVESGWRNLVGDHLLSAKSGEVANVIAETIKEHYIQESETTNTTVEETKTEPEVEVEKPKEDLVL